MSGLKQLRNRVKSVKSTQKITKAMQVVSAAKLRRIKDHAEALDDYSSVLVKIMNDIRLDINFVDLSPLDRKFFKEDVEDKPFLFLVMTSERGLCGSFNSQIIRAVKRDIAKFTEQNIKVKLIVVGKKGYDALKGGYSDLIVEYYHVIKDNFLPVALQIKDKIINLTEQDKIGACYLYYNEFKNALTQVMTRISVFPVEQLEETPQTNSEVSVSSKCEYEGSNLVNILINLYIAGVIKYSFLQNKASEEAARMTAMDSATRNAGELIEKLTLKLNRSRQAMITTELTEIISGAEAL
jgi:F-type H+-transporting ATPase subunit gamma